MAATVAGININKKRKRRRKEMKKNLVSMMIAVLCLVAGTARGYVIDPQIGVELVQINYGDVQGVYGLAKWLKSQDLLPVNADVKKMSVAEGYVKMCLKNFDTLGECETASLKLQPGQTLKIFAPVMARQAYNERLIKPLEAEIEAKDQQIAAIEAVAGIATVKAEKAEAMLKSVAAEARKIKSEIAELQLEKDFLASRNEELTARLGASKRAFEMQVTTTENLKRELSIGLRTQISGLMKAFDEFADRRLASFDLLDVDSNSIILLSVACVVIALLLARARKAERVRTKIAERIREGRRRPIPSS